LEQYQKINIKYEHHLEYLHSLIPKNDCVFFVSGYSYTAEKCVDFLCDFKCSGSGYPHINWRERVVCPVTGLNNRMRAAIHVYDLFSNTDETSNVYIMEQTTFLYKYLKEKQQNLIGSEFLGSAVPLGSVNELGIRNEDATSLSFRNNSLDTILSFDVFEHIYDYKKAFTESARVLRKDGCMIFTVPFSLTASENIERAIMNSEGQVEHLMKPEYHGDPVSGEGILCFRHYGWNMLKDLRDAGFRDAYAVIFNSTAFGYYTNQVIFYAQK
jgi:SAM-dependent methyltransferase